MRACMHILLAACLVCVFATTNLEAKAFEESQVKAVFLYNLTKFVTWSPQKSEPGKHFLIGVLGKDPIKEHLDWVVINETVQNREIEVTYYSNPEEIDWQQLHMLFISRKFKSMGKELATTAQQQQVLTVGDTPNFCHYGGMINLLTVGKRVKIEVNLSSVKASKLKISAQVLKLARLIEKAPETSQ